MNCPKCLGKLNKVEIKLHELPDMPKPTSALISTIEVDQCFVCNGVWFDAGELQKYIEKKLTIIDSPAIDFDLIERFDKKISSCPRCNIDMVKKTAPLNKNITVDFCEKCSGIWLDNTEIDRIEAKNIGFKEKVGLLIKSLIPHRQ